MTSLILYGISVILVIYIIISIAKTRSFKIGDAVVVLGIAISIIIAQSIPPPAWPSIFNQEKLILTEDFNDGIANGIQASNSKIEIINVDKTDKALQVINSSTTEWGHFEVAEVTFTNGTIEYSVNLADYDMSLGNGSGSIASHFRSTPQQRYLFAIVPESQSLSLNYQGTDSSNTWIPLSKGSSAYNLSQSTWHKVKINLNKDKITVYFDEVQVLNSNDERLKTGIIFWSIAPSTTILFDDLHIWGKQ